MLDPGYGFGKRSGENYALLARQAELLHLADEAMYLVKNTTRDSVAVAGMGLLQLGS